MDLDAELPAIIAGDADAFGRWLAAAERPVRESLRSFAAVLDVEAVLQEALLRVWQVAPRFQYDGRPNGLLRLDDLAESLGMRLNTFLQNMTRSRKSLLTGQYVGMRLNTFLQNMTRARQFLADCLRRRGIILDVELGS